MTIQQLLASAQVIHDETSPGANTHQRIGQMFIDIINTLGAVPGAQPLISGGNLWFNNIPTNVGASSQSLAANILYAIPWLVPSDISVTDMAFLLTSNPAGLLSIAVYDDDGNGYPGAQIAATLIEGHDTSGGTLVQLAPGAPIALQAGLKWIVVHSNAAPSMAMVPGTQGQHFLPKTGPSLSSGGWPSHIEIATAYANLPDPFTAGATEALRNLPQYFYTV